VITIDIDLKALTAGLDDLQKRQIPFAVARGLNTLAKEGQVLVRQSLSSNFTINESKRAFLERTVRIGRDDWARKDRLAVRLGINPTDQAAAGLGKDRSQLLGRHEEGGQRTADPARPFFIPTNEIRPGAYDVVARSLYPSSLRVFDRRTADGVLGPKGRRTRKGGFQIQGKRRTFIIDGRSTNDPRLWGVFQRTGSGRRDIRMLWAFRTKIQIAPRLKFYETMERALNARMTEVLSASLAQAIATAR
jgi:hypothetical protein